MLKEDLVTILNSSIQSSLLDIKFKFVFENVMIIFKQVKYIV